VQGVIFSVFGGVGTAATLQALYERLYGLESRGMKDFHRQLIWIGAVLGAAVFVGWAGPHARGITGGPIVLGAFAFLFNVVFWLFTMWLLISDRVPWRQLLAPAVATSAFWLGLGVFSKFFFSNTVIGDNREYGSIGVVFALMSWLIAVGVVIILGAVVGIVWRETDLSFKAAFRRLMRSRRHGPEKAAGLANPQARAEPSSSVAGVQAGPSSEGR
ncbi:MAG: YhjD/YihY/BrkB family envelope integrity protein, partial [Acidimicrobiales bacterium]